MNSCVLVVMRGLLFLVVVVVDVQSLVCEWNVGKCTIVRVLSDKIVNLHLLIPKFLGNDGGGLHTCNN